MLPLPVLRRLSLPVLLSALAGCSGGPLSDSAERTETVLVAGDVPGNGTGFTITTPTHKLMTARDAQKAMGDAGKALANYTPPAG